MEGWQPMASTPSERAVQVRRELPADWDNVSVTARAGLADCPFGVESWEVGPGLLPALWHEATPFVARHLLTGYDAVSRLTRQENDDLPALALVAALGLVDYFIREYDLVEESWLRTVHWIGGNFGALRLPARFTGGPAGRGGG
jgi:hypothetical protein